MVKKMDAYKEGLDFVFSFSFEKLRLLFGLVSRSGSHAFASEMPMEGKDVGGCGGLSQDFSMFHSAAMRIF